MRIRYIKTQEPTTLQSTQIYHHPSNGARYRVLLDTANNSWKVVDDATSTVALAGNASSPALARIGARKALESLGVVFESETRTRQLKPAQVQAQS